ncbi:endonuclease/exonuclease/phosphatase family protein [Actinoplanes bogorensis]|uniref:Endonuclease/exonuclease/phosphatase family protein n=1 Tax=Paractinoplanes bogorensis TaxID=1610840 RepID=A0ABS5Z0K8_9ACTN|nr:endonuclease/exonuclease/phosphatase family protein [Actinoplanes bogorensis]MBU2669182.1 endonuclease/exonuclease/phosphatase family protein [Actinoplanes bogorensis]
MAMRVGRVGTDRRSALRSLVSAVLAVVSALSVTAAPGGAATSEMDALAGPAAPADLHVMTFNLRFGSPAEPNSWAQRRPVMRSLLTTEKPDLIGTQEGLAGQLHDLETDLGPGYDFLGKGRLGGDRSEFMAVFYRRERLTPQAYGNFWLSDTPEVPGSDTWNGFAVRMVTWVRFLDRATGKRFYAVNTHLDNLSELARRRSAELIRTRVAAFEPRLPTILTGDFNTPAGASSEVYGDFVEQAGYRDTWTTAPVRGPAYGTFHGYQPLQPDGPRIDWILTSPAITVSAVLINTYRRDTQFPSDHLPVQARLRLP